MKNEWQTGERERGWVNQRMKRFWMLTLALLIGFVQMLPMSGAMAAGAGGTTYYVKMLEDGGKDENSGTSWDDAYATLQKALESARSGDKIRIAKGTYYPTKESYSGDINPSRTKTFQMKNGVEIYGGYSGIGTERNLTDYTTTLSGDIGVVGDPSDNAYHIFHNRNVDQSAKLDGVTVTGGNASGYYVYDQDGGGMYNYQSSPTLQDVTFFDNTAKRQGGGIANSNNSSPDLIGGEIKENQAQFGGGMFNGDNSSPTLTQVKISKNKAGGNGGGINNYRSIPTLEDMEISENEAGVFGGGLYNFESSPILTKIEIKGNNSKNSSGGVHNTQGSHAVFTNVKIIENEAVAGSGGGINNDRSNSTLTDVEIIGNKAGTDGGGVYHSSEGGVFIDVTISENTAARNGGGVRFDTGSNSTLTNVEIIKNQANNGGGIYNYYSNDIMTNVKISENEATNDGGGIVNYGASSKISGAEVKGNTAGSSGGGIYTNGGTNIMTNAEISGNHANVSGGGIYNFSSNPALTNVTISGNEADASGSGIFIQHSTSASFRNSIVWGNENDDIYYGNKGSIQVSHSLIGHSQPNNGNGGTGNLFNSDPAFIDSARGNYRLGKDSPAINLGSTVYFDAGSTPDLSAILTDRDNNPRFVGEGIDMGAYEYQDNEARLNSLNLEADNKALELIPKFSGAVTNYHAFVNLGASEVKITPTLKDLLAAGEIRINGNVLPSFVSGAEHALQLGNGENEIQLQVTAKDGTVKTYTVTISNLPKPVLALSHTNWTNQDVTITASNRKAGANLEYSTDHQSWVPNPDGANPDSIVVTAEGSYSVYVRQADAVQSVSEEAEVQVRIDKTAPVITLNGDLQMSIHKGDPFIDPGVQVSDALDPSPMLSKSGTVDISRLGDYTLSYQAVDHAGNQANPVTRTVKVVREGALLEPTISLDPSGWTKGDVEVTLSGEADALLEYSLDGQVWSAYVSPFSIHDENQTKLYARQTDALQNVSEIAEAEVRIDRIAPTITLHGAATMNLYRGSVFQDPGVTITDNIVTGLTPVITGTVDTSKLDTYTLQYDAKDWAGNQAAPVIRRVRVMNRPVTPLPPVVVPVTSVTLTPPALTLTLGGEPVTLHAAITPSNATNQAVSWSSSDTGVVVVDENGSLIAKQTGRATITVTTQDGSKTASSEVTVVKEGAEKLRLEVSPATIRLSPGESKAFKVYAVEGKGRKDITKNKDTSYDLEQDLVTVKQGRITAGKKAGEAQVIVRYRGSEATVTVTVEKKEADSPILEASESMLLIKPSRTASFKVYLMENGRRKDITKDKNTTYSIDSKLAKVTAGRVTTAKAEGETDLIVRYQGEELTIPVVISQVTVKSLSASAKQVVLEMEEEQTLRIQAVLSNKQEEDVTERVRWSTSTPDIVEVDKEGVLVPLKKGRAVLTAKYGGKTVKASVLVVEEKKPQQLRANRASLTLRAEQSVSTIITAVYEGSYKEDVTEEVEWSVEDPEIVQVEDGVITGGSAGTTTIKASYAGKEVKIRITVRK
ncbi:immunoglobulin-like domain-containing protein [Brevibacillus invocatus]|uniref:immunoglobulin-like domain-containing protein n=1 Tax=Brevibacillus invocatus TaxID=173959 RepID=UPI00203E70CB|nr:immunoglobulin-like domain-containing protein [Brevibacillus invocatus]MCM3077717.1 DUF5011 domain-containing protein [Brevibacillus invocatus]MCM3428718.1 DUF5011 domain-containing protein [Brevibacillus invocatus]